MVYYLLSGVRQAAVAYAKLVVHRFGQCLFVAFEVRDSLPSDAFDVETHDRRALTALDHRRVERVLYQFAHYTRRPQVAERRRAERREPFV